MKPTNLLRLITGRGTSPEATNHWWAQRMTAMALIPLSLWLIVSAIFMMDDSYVAIYQWVRSTPTTIGLILFTIAAFHHTHLGMQVIYEDYIPHEGLKIAAILLTKSIFLIMGLLVILSILRIYLAPI